MDFSLPGSSKPKNMIFWPVGWYTHSIGLSVHLNRWESPSSAMAHVTWAYTEFLRVLPTLRRTAAWQSGCFKRSKMSSTEINELLVLPRPPFSTNSLMSPLLIALWLSTKTGEIISDIRLDVIDYLHPLSGGLTILPEDVYQHFGGLSIALDGCKEEPLEHRHLLAYILGLITD